MMLRTAALVFVLVIASGGAPQAEIIDRVLAVAAGDVIMLSDVVAARELGLVSASDGPDPARDALTQLIDRSLILAEVERYVPPEPRAEVVDSELQAVRARFPSPQAYDAALARAGIREAHLRETVRQNLRIRAYLEQRFTVPAPPEQELERYYREHPERFARNGAVPPMEEVRAQVEAAATEERRLRLMDEWLAGLRRRAEILDLYLPTKKN